MGPVLKEVGYEQRQVSDLGEIVAKSLRLSGTGAAEATSTMRQFVQAMGSGVLRGDEFNSLMENAPVLMHNLARGMDVPIGQLRKMAEEGELSSKKVAEALLKMKDRIDKDFSQLPVSVSQSWQRLINDVQTGIGEMDKANGATATLAKGLEVVRANLDSVAKAGALIVGGLAFLGTAAALATPVGQAIAVVAVSAAALTAGFKLLGSEQKKLAADTTKTDEVMGELNKAIVKLSAEKADPGIIEGIKRVREAAASGAISIDQAAEALGKFIALRESVQGKGTAAETFFKEFVFDQKKFDQQLKEIEDHAAAARARGTLNQAAHERAVNKLIEDANKQKQALYNADAQARLKAMIPPTEAVRDALQKLDTEYQIAKKNGIADEVKYQNDRAKIIAEALADGAGKVAETRQRISQETRQRAIGDLAFQEEQIRKGYEAEIAASRGQIDESELRANIEKRIAADIGALHKKLAGEFIAGSDAATQAALKNAKALAAGEKAAATEVAAVWSKANAVKAQKTGGAIMNQGTPGEFVSSWDTAGNYVGDLGTTVSRAGGGPIRGPGSGTSDSILARVSNGEYVVRAAAVSRYGSGFMDAINRMALPKFADGGPVGSAPSAMPASISIANITLPGVANVESFIAELEQISRTRPLRINTVSHGQRRG
jgi:tape measure domain-containing protein